MRSFKVWDNDKEIQPGEKECQTDITSALLRFYDHYSCFSDNIPSLPLFELCVTIFVQKSQLSGKGANRKSKIEIFSKTAVVVVKPF